MAAAMKRVCRHQRIKIRECRRTTRSSTSPTKFDFALDLAHLVRGHSYTAHASPYHAHIRRIAPGTPFSCISHRAPNTRIISRYRKLHQARKPVRSTLNPSTERVLFSETTNHFSSSPLTANCTSTIATPSEPRPRAVAPDKYAGLTDIWWSATPLSPSSPRSTFHQIQQERPVRQHRSSPLRPSESAANPPPCTPQFHIST